MKRRPQRPWSPKPPKLVRATTQTTLSTKTTSRMYLSPPSPPLWLIIIEVRAAILRSRFCWLRSSSNNNIMLKSHARTYIYNLHSTFKLQHIFLYIKEMRQQLWLTTRISYCLCFVYILYNCSVYWQIIDDCHDSGKCMVHQFSFLMFQDQFISPQRARHPNWRRPTPPWSPPCWPSPSGQPSPRGQAKQASRSTSRARDIV